MLDFLQNKVDGRKLKNVHELVQHFCEQCEHDVRQQNISYKLALINS